LFRIFPQNFIRGNAATNNTPNEGEKKIIEGKSRKSKGYSILKKFISGLEFLITFEIKGNLNSANYLDLLLTKVGTAL
jgi:hypothetical protein